MTHILYERCTCGAEIRIEAESPKGATADRDRWRTEHRHEWAPGDRYADHTSREGHTGFTTERDGRIEEVL